MNFVWGIGVITIGALITIKSEVILSMFGRIELFEKYLGTDGGSRLGYKLLGILVIFIGILIFSNLFNGFMLWILSPLINAGK